MIKIGSYLFLLVRLDHDTHVLRIRHADIDTGNNADPNRYRTIHDLELDERTVGCYLAEGRRPPRPGWSPTAQQNNTH